MTDKSHIDHKLINGLKKGRREAQRALYEQYKVPLFGVCRRYTKTKQDAEDQLQEAFIKIFKDVKAYRSQGSFQGWMRRIVVNTCLMHIRREKTFYLMGEVPEVAVEMEEIKIGTGSKERAQAIILLVQQLPLAQQTVFNLKVMEDYKFTEIAELLGMNDSTVRSHYLRARKKLQNLIEKSLTTNN